MNIVMIHPHDLYSPSEPWTSRIKNIAYEFVKNGHSVKLVYFPLNKKDIHKTIPDNGVEIISLDRRLGAGILLKNTLRIAGLARWADIIHFQKCYYYVVLPAVIASLAKNKPLHYDWDDWETKIFYYSNPQNRIVGEFLNIFERLTPCIADTVSVSSDHLRTRCLKLGVRPENIFTASVGADVQMFTPARADSTSGIKRRYNINNSLVLYLGQLHGGQYAELFIRAARIVIEKTRDVTFMIVGDGYRAGELKALAKSEGLNKYFIFTGFVAHDEIPDYIRAADVCVACFEDNDITRSKSPLKIVEYLSCGKAIVASNVGEVRKMVGGVGVLVTPGDSHALGCGILRLLHDKPLRDNLGRFARQRAERTYNWAATAASLLSAYEKSVRQRSAQ
jgi:glycosyltransferase involved in cell wall biosynthesis